MLGTAVGQEAAGRRALVSGPVAAEAGRRGSGRGGSRRGAWARSRAWDRLARGGSDVPGTRTGARGLGREVSTLDVASHGPGSRTAGSEERRQGRLWEESGAGGGLVLLPHWELAWFRGRAVLSWNLSHTI